MLASMEPPISLAEKTKRRRKSHPKSRLGCFTCKIRRKKCGEEKPTCLRCTSTGHKCDGYPKDKQSSLPTPPTPPESCEDISFTEWGLENGAKDSAVVPEAWDVELVPFTFDNPSASEQWEPTKDGSAIASDNSSELEDRVLMALHSPASPSSTPFASERDLQCFEFFCEKTNPLFTHYFETTMWQGPMMQACSHPAVRQAMIALGAVHRRYELGITPEAFDYCDFSTRSYNKARAVTQQTLRADDSNFVSLAVILSWIFGAFEVFQGNEKGATKHIQGGLRAFFAQNFRKVESRTTRRNDVLNEKNIRALFERLENKANEIFDGPARISPRPECHGRLPECPSHFYSLSHARDILFTQLHWILHFLTHRGAGHLEIQQNHAAHILQWSAAYASFCESETRKPRNANRAAASCLLRICRETAYLLLLIHPNAEQHSALNDFCAAQHTVTSCARAERLNVHFAKLLITSDRLLGSSSAYTNSIGTPFSSSIARPSFTVDSGINPPLHLAETACTSAKVRIQAASLIPPESNVWAGLGACSVAEKTSLIEEAAAVKCGAIEGVEPIWLDLTCFMEDRRVLRSYCVKDKGLGVYGGLVWCQEWISF